MDSLFADGGAVERAAVSLILTLFLLTGLAYSLVVPPFETPDELFHYAFARHLAAGNGLPVQAAEKTGPWEQEGSQPPLYYSLVALVTAGIDQTGLADYAVRNPRANMGDPHRPGNKNFMLYSAQSAPLRGVNLALHVGRWISLILGALTIFFTYLLARYAFPHDRWSRLLATSLAATIPQFIFISASLSNDSLITFTSAVALVCLAALRSRARSHHLQRRHWIGLGFILGLATLSKLQGLGLLPLTAAAILLNVRLKTAWRSVLEGALLVGLSVLIVAGWWYLRNVELYGDPFGTQNLLSVTGVRVEPLTFQGLFGELRGLQMSFFGIFGWFSILLPPWTYTLFELLTVLAAVGALITWWQTLRYPSLISLRQQLGSVTGISALWVLISLALLAYWISVAQGSQGRLLFPAISGLAVIAVVGLRFWAGFLPLVARIALGVAVPLGLWACSLYALAVLMPDSYGLDGMASVVDELPSDARPIGKMYGDGVELVAARLPDREAFAGERVPLTLYFRAHQKQTRDHELFIHLLDAAGEQIGNLTTQPGWGVRPLTLWEPILLYEDDYLIPLDRASPALARVYVGFTDPSSTALESEGLLPVRGGGPRIESRVIWTYYKRLDPLPVEFDTGISLVGFALGQGDAQLATQEVVEIDGAETIWVALRWEDEAGSDISYAASLRLYAAGEGRWVVQEDADLLRSGGAPAGQSARTQYDKLMQLAVPPDIPNGDYELRLTVYNTETLQPAVQVGVWEPEVLLARIRLH